MAKVASPTITFILKNRPDRNGECPVQLLVRYNGRVERSTGVKVKPSQWSADKQTVKRSHPRHSELNAALMSARERISSAVARLMASGRPYTAAQVVELSETPSAGLAMTVSGAYDLYVSDSSLRRSTRKAYECSKAKFMKFAGREIKLSEFDKKLLDRYVKWLYESGLCALSVNQYLRCMHAALAHACEVTGGQADLSHLTKVLNKTPRAVKSRRQVLNEEQIKILSDFLCQCSVPLITSRSTPYGRLAVWLTDYFLCGLSPVDAALLKVSDLALSDNSLTVRGFRRKTGKPFGFTVPLTSSLRHLLSAFISTAERREGFLLPILRGGDIEKPCDLNDEGSVTLAVRKYCNAFAYYIQKAFSIVASWSGRDRSFFPKTVSMYSARHSFATNFSSKSKNLRALATALGRQVSTLDTYIRELTSESESLSEMSKVFGS